MPAAVASCSISVFASVFTLPTIVVTSELSINCCKSSGSPPPAPSPPSPWPLASCAIDGPFGTSGSTPMMRSGTAMPACAMNATSTAGATAVPTERTSDSVASAEFDSLSFVFASIM